MRWITLAALILGAWVVRSLLSQPNPPEVLIPQAFLTKSVKLKSEPFLIQWSPSSRWLLIRAKDEAALLELADPARLQRITPVPDERNEIAWSQDSRLWVRTANGWVVYSPGNSNPARFPWQKPNVPLKEVEGKPDSSGNDLLPPNWVFAPDLKTTVTLTQRSSMRTRGNTSFYEDDYRLVGWRGGKRQFERTFKPKHTGSARQVGFGDFSPDGRRVALVVTGWEAYEQPGQEEIWVLDLESHELSFLCEGKTGFSWWPSDWWDYHVQRGFQSWLADGSAIIIGDRQFGVELVDVASGRKKVILAPNWGSRPRASREWIAYDRSDRADGELAVARIDGAAWGRVPLKTENVHTWSWSPLTNTLAAIGGGPRSGEYIIQLWNMPKTK